MSDDSTTTGETTAADDQQSRAERAAELTNQAQALFGVGSLAADEATAEETADGPGSDGGPHVDDRGAADGTADVEQAVAAVADDAGAEDSPDEAADDAGADADASTTDADADASTTDADVQPVADSEQAQDVPEPASATPSYSFGLVFQAPDLSDLPQRRSRRATAGVTTPVPPAEVAPDQQPDEAPEAGGDDSATDDPADRAGRRRRRGGKGRRGRGQSDTDPEETEASEPAEETTGEPSAESAEGEGDQSSAGSSRRRSRSRTRGRSGARDEASPDTGGGEDSSEAGPTEDDEDDASGTRRRRRRRRSGESGSQERPARDEVTSVKGSTRLEAKRQRRREGREAGRRRTIITEAEFLARRESVDRVMVVRGLEDRTQIAVLEDGVPVEHYVSRSAQSTMVGNVYLGRVQNVLPSMEAAFVDIGKGRNAVLYAGEVNWDAAGLDGQPKRIENALRSGESVLVQVTKDPIGHKGARLTSQISLPGRFLVYVPGNSMTGISRKLPDTERARLKKILKEVVPDEAGVIVRTAAEGASEAELRADVERLTTTWDRISTTAAARSASAPVLLHGEPDMTVRVIRDVFTEDFSRLIVSGDQAWTEVKRYIDDVAPDLADRVEKHTGTQDIFTAHRVHEAIAKAMDRKVWLPSGGSLVIDRTEAMTVVDVNTGKFTGSGGNLEETVTKNNIEAAEEIVRQLRLRDIGGIIVIDFIDMVLESNRDLVVRRLLECLGRDRTKHQVAEVTSLGLVQMTRKRVGSGLIEVFSETCVHCAGRGVVVQAEPVARNGHGNGDSGHNGGNGNGNGGTDGGAGAKRGRGRGRGGSAQGAGSGAGSGEPRNVLPTPNPKGPTPAQIAAAAHAAALNAGASAEAASAAADAASQQVAEPGAPDYSEVAEPGVPVPQEVADIAPGEPAAAPPLDVDGSAAAALSPEPPVTEGSEVVEPAAAAPPRRARSRARSGATAPADMTQPASEAVTQPVVDAVTQPVVDAVGTESDVEQNQPPAAAQAVPDQEQTPEEKPRRRRRGRVSAPAGPPSAAEAGGTD